MIAQRPAAAAPVVQAVAEALPLTDRSVDAAMAVLTVHHWDDIGRGVAELKRVARHRVLIMTWDADVTDDYWLLREYFPAAAAVDRAQAVPIIELYELLDGHLVEPVLIPHDCTDGFGGAFWRRPEAYLNPTVRAGMSMLARTGEHNLADGLAALTDDLAAGRWHQRHADLLNRETIDLGYRLIIADV